MFQEFTVTKAYLEHVDFALSIRSEIMFLFEKIAMCTEVEKILSQRHLSTSEDTTRTSVSHPSTC